MSLDRKLDEVERRMLDVLSRAYEDYMGNEGSDVPCPPVLVNLLAKTHGCLLARAKTLAVGGDVEELSPQELVLRLTKALENVKEKIRYEQGLQ